MILENKIENELDDIGKSIKIQLIPKECNDITLEKTNLRRNCPRCNQIINCKSKESYFYGGNKRTVCKKCRPDNGEIPIREYKP